MPYCPNCGAENEADAAYCGSCGARLEVEAAPAPSAAPARARFPWAIVVAIVALAAVVTGGVFIYNAVTGEEDEQERVVDDEDERTAVAGVSPTASATPEVTATAEPTATPPAPSGYATPEEAIAEAVAPSEYAGDCASADPEEDIGKVCSSFFGGSGSQLVYRLGTTFAEFTVYALVEQQADESWLVVDSAPLDGGTLQPPWPVVPEPSVIGYNLPAQAITVYLEDYGLEYVGDCDYADLETDVGSYCSILWEDRGDQLIYTVGLAFSEPEAWLLLALQPEPGGWLVVDVADFVPGPQDTVPPWP